MPASIPLIVLFMLCVGLYVKTSGQEKDMSVLRQRLRAHDNEIDFLKQALTNLTDTPTMPPNAVKAEQLSSAAGRAVGGDEKTQVSTLPSSDDAVDDDEKTQIRALSAEEKTQISPGNTP